MGCNASSFSFFKATGISLAIEMKDELCRICGCEVKDLKKCPKCKLITSTICKCCKNIEKSQTHSH